MKFTTNPKNAKIIAMLVDILAGLELDQIVSYGTLKTTLGFDIRERRYLLARARKQAENRTREYFSAVRGVGIQRLHPDYAGQVGTNSIRSIRRKGNRDQKRIANGEMNNKMTSDGRELAIRKRVQLALITDLANNQRKDFSSAPPANHGPRSGFKR